MQQKLTRNTFEGGRNTDTDKNKLAPNQYVEAHNVELVGDGSFDSLKNIKGTANVKDIVGDTECIGVFNNNYRFVEDAIDPVSDWSQIFAGPGIVWTIGSTAVFTSTPSSVSKVLTTGFIATTTSYTIDYDITYSGSVAGSVQIGFQISGVFISSQVINLVIGSNIGTITLSSSPTAQLNLVGTLGTGAGGGTITINTLFSEGATPIIQPCLTIFTVSESLFKIWCYNLTTTILYELYEETIDSDYITEDRVIDAKNYPENGVDILYFTDNFNPLRLLRCEINTTTYSLNFLSEYDISLQRRGGLGTVSFDDMVDGSLLSGTYQFSYRMVNPSTKALTKWSTLSNPIHVYSAANSSSPVYSGVGLSTPFGIQINVAPSTDELTAFDYFQLAVVENVYPTTGTATTASLLPITSTSNRLNYQYKSNTKVGEISIADIVVDLAQINTVKTLNIKQNRLFLANLGYLDLTFDNGDPAITSGTIKRRVDSSTDAYSNQEFATKYIGYFRDEVYRFGIVYYDKYGNKSPVKVLDLSDITDNQISSGLVDMRFPDRSFNSSYSLFGSSNRLQALGLNLIGIKNHPTWATKFEIVRARRLKNVLFQTPLIPMVSVKGIGALAKYPTQSTTGTYPNAVPQTPSEILVPKNYFFSEGRNIISNGAAVANTQVGEAVYLESQANYFLSIYPQPTMYGDTPFNFTGGERVDVIDYALLKLKSSTFTPSKSPTPVVLGDDVDTNITGTFYALSNTSYYFDNLSNKSSIEQLIRISDYEYFPNLSSGGVVSGQSVLKYSELNTEGITLGTPPTVCANAVIKIQNNLGDLNISGVSFAGATLNPYARGSYITGSSGPTYNNSQLLGLTNLYLPSYSNYTDASSYVGSVKIGNIISGVSDDRYGDMFTSHEYIPTGASHTFTTSELSDVQSRIQVPITLEVWGGDCFVGPQVFKISDSCYSITNVQKSYAGSQTGDELKSKWNNFAFANSSGIGISLPVALSNVGQFIEVIIESEYNGEVRDSDVLTSITSVGGVPVLGVSNKQSIRSPLTYQYNLNLSKPNSEKVYFTKPQFNFEQTDFSARVAYSDLKIYNTSEQGFDVFRVLNYYDLEEKRGPITKLAIAEDDLYAIQTKGIVYLPTGQTQLQQTDGSQLAVGTSDIIGRPIVVDSERGGQHLRGILETGKLIVIPDNKNKAIYQLSGQQLIVISDRNNNTTFRDFFLTSIPEKNLISIYNPIRSEYWFVDNLNYRCEVYNEDSGWVCDYEFSADAKVDGGVYTNLTSYLIGTGVDSDQLAVHEMYTGPDNYLMGTTVVPRVTVSVNPDGDISKVFDNMMLAATERLSTMDITIDHEASIGDQVVTGMDLDVESIEGNYRIKVLLDENNSRLRGLRALTTIKWGELSSTLTALYTKYRLSPKSPF